MPKKKRLLATDSSVEDEPRTMMSRIRAAMPSIEAGLRAGHSLKDMHERLNQDGLEIPYQHLVVYRHRMRRGKPNRPEFAPVPGKIGGLEMPERDAPYIPSPDGFDPAANFPKFSKKQVSWEYPSGAPDENKLVNGDE